MVSSNSASNSFSLGLSFRENKEIILVGLTHQISRVQVDVSQI
jgi:hypothetical protein